MYVHVHMTERVNEEILLGRKCISMQQTHQLLHYNCSYDLQYNLGPIRIEREIISIPSREEVYFYANCKSIIAMVFALTPPIRTTIYKK